MKENNNLARHLAVAAAIAALCGTSAFADVRHREETARGGSSDHGARVERSNRDNGAAQRQVEQQRETRSQNWDRNRSQQQTGDRNNRSSSNWNRNESRSTATEWRNNNRSNDWNRNNNRSNDWNRNNRSNDWNRNNNRSNDWNRNNRNNNYYRGGRAPYFYNGRISRYERWNGGFRVYIGGAPYPFFVPEAYFFSHGWRAGLSIRIGGYYNPLGYYDYYDGPYDGYYGSSVATAGALRGVVESVDYRRGTVVVRDDISGDFVSTVMRGRDRTFDTLRPGDYIELRGDWVRGVFEAYQADLLGDRYYR